MNTNAAGVAGIGDTPNILHPRSRSWIQAPQRTLSVQLRVRQVRSGMVRWTRGGLAPWSGSGSPGAHTSLALLSRRHPCPCPCPLPFLGLKGTQNNRHPFLLP